MGDNIKSDKFCIIGDDLANVYEPIPLDYIKAYFYEDMKELDIILQNTGRVYSVDVSHSKDNKLENNVAAAFTGKEWYKLCMDINFICCVMICLISTFDTFGGFVYQPHRHNIRVVIYFMLVATKWVVCLIMPLGRLLDCKRWIKMRW